MQGYIIARTVLIGFISVNLPKKHNRMAFAKVKFLATINLSGSD
jgi:hypothetical protein